MTTSKLSQETPAELDDAWRGLLKGSKNEQSIGSCQPCISHSVFRHQISINDMATRFWANETISLLGINEPS